MINQFLNDEARKDGAISETLWDCDSQIQAQITNKIRWSFEENKIVGSVSQQNQQFGQGASTSSDAPRFIEQQEYQPQLTQFGLGYEEDAGWNESKEQKLSKLEA